MDTTQTVLEFFDKRGGLPGETLEQKLACHFLDAKVIDSMGIVEMVSELEEAFGIRFDADDMQSEEFQTARGLIGIIDRLRAQAAG